MSVDLKSLGYNPPRFFWALRLQSGEELWQFHPETGKELQVKDIKEKYPNFLRETAVLALLPFTPDLAEKVLKAEERICISTSFPPVRIDFEEGWRPIFYRSQAVIFSGPRAGERETFYHIGYQFNVEGKNVKVILTRDDNGFIFLNHYSTRNNPPKVFEEEEKKC